MFLRIAAVAVPFFLIVSCGQSASQSSAPDTNVSGEEATDAAPDGPLYAGDPDESSAPDVAPTPDAVVVAPDVPPTPDVAVTTPDAVSSTEWVPKSSFQKCLCWKKGDQCHLPFTATKIPIDPKYACPEGEACDGGSEVVQHYPKYIVHGTCRRLCYHKDAQVKGTGGCAAGEKCKVVKIHVFDTDLFIVGMCVEDGVAIGGDQTGNKSCDKYEFLYEDKACGVVPKDQVPKCTEKGDGKCHLLCSSDSDCKGLPNTPYCSKLGLFKSGDYGCNGTVKVCRSEAKDDCSK